MTVATKLKELVDNYNKTKLKLAEEFGNALSGMCVDGITRFSWQQYTPYFMDGETCYFGVGLDSVEFKGDNYAFRRYPNENSPPEVTALQALLRRIPDEIYETSFGDHKEVTVTKDIVVVDDYDHE